MPLRVQLTRIPFREDGRDRSSIPEAARTTKCEDIAAQLINFEVYLERKFPNIDVDGLEVVLGGRATFFTESRSP